MYALKTTGELTTLLLELKGKVVYTELMKEWGEKSATIKIRYFEDFCCKWKINMASNQYGK